jgi:carbon storage regulator
MVMLVLSRKPGEKIVIGDGIEVMVVAVNGNRVRLGFVAPAKCRIARAECGKKDPRVGDDSRKLSLMAGCGV